MITQVLKDFGLDDKEIIVFTLLLKNGPSRASVLAYQSKFPRTSVQNVLVRLEKEGLVNKMLEENTYVYTAIDPENLSRLVRIKERQEVAKYQKLISDIQMVIPEIKGIMSSNVNFPKVRFYKGRDAVRKVLFDTLTSKTELKDFANIDAMFEFAKDINDEYVAAREKTNITKRSLLLETEFAKEVYECGTYSPKSHKGYKWINSLLYPFAVEVNIYDGKVSYITYVEDDFVGVIIENQYIYQMHDSMWNLLWDLLPDSVN